MILLLALSSPQKKDREIVLAVEKGIQVIMMMPSYKKNSYKKERIYLMIFPNKT